MFSTSKRRQKIGFHDQDKANCLNDYFASISTVNNEHTQLPPFTKLTDNSLSYINCTEHEIETTIDVLNPNEASGDKSLNVQGCLQICFKTLMYFDESIL